MLENYWYIVAQEKRAQKQPLSVQLFGKYLVVFKISEGRYAALEDRCAHRHAPLSKGKVENGCIACPYHGWAYGGDGKLNNIPALASKDCPDIQIPSYACMAQDGYVWVCLGTPEHEKPRPFPHLKEDGWITFRMRNRFEGSVEQCLENFLDCPHALQVHESWFRTPVGRPVNTKSQMLEDGAIIEYENEPREKSAVWALVQNRNESLKHTDRYIAPSTSRVDYIFSEEKHYIITSSCTPVTGDVTDVFTVITFKYPQWGWLVRLFFEPLSHLIIRQDIDIMRLQQKNMNRFEQGAFVYTKADLMIPHILKWRTALAKGKKPEITDKVKIQEIIF